jgi:putative membrane protein
MERRLLRGIINPAMIATWLFGLLLVWQGDWWGQGWLYGKLVLLLAMQLVHAGLARWRRDFAADANRHSQRFFRIVNEIPTVLLIGIVILVVVKPF